MPRGEVLGPGLRTRGLAGLRGELLAAIRAASEPIGIADLASRCGVHRNTVRANLEVLESEGLVESRSRPTGGKGRPRLVFVATTAGAHTGDRNFLLLAEILTAGIVHTADRPAELARQAGQRWGADFVADRRRAGDARGARRLLHDVLESIGFEPDRRLTARTRELVTLNCPFLEAVDARQDVVCAIHLGLMEGVLGSAEPSAATGPGRGVGPATDLVALDPFGTSTGCLVRLSARSAGGNAQEAHPGGCRRGGAPTEAPGGCGSPHVDCEPPGAHAPSREDT